MERRLIDANALNVTVALYMAENAYLNDTALDVLKKVSKWIETEPTIDAVEVVRCRECAYMHVPRCCPCQISGFKVDDDWYCPMGVRREPDGE